MSLSVQNKSFLAVLNKLDIDVKQFPDKTFDGLFDNIPKDINYFFNWFIENISSDNALTYLEQAIYFQLESCQSLLTEEELNFTLASYSPSYEELMSLNMNYINFLSQNLDDSKRNYKELSEILTAIEANYNDVKQMQNCMKKEINIKKKLLEAIKQDCHQINLSVGCVTDKVKLFLLDDSYHRLDLNLFKTLEENEKCMFYNFTKSKLLENKIFSCTRLDSVPKLKEDLACIEISMVISEGLLKGKKAKIDFLLCLLQKKSCEKNFNCNFMQSYLINNEEINFKISEEIKSLETELFDKIKMLSDNEVQQIADHYLSNEIDLKSSYMTKLTHCKNLLMSDRKLNSYLLHILLRSIIAMENKLNLKKRLYSKLIEYETNFSNDIANLELRMQRFREVTAHQNQHPLLLALKTVMNFEDNIESNEETLKKMTELILHANDDSNFITHKFRNHLQSSIKAFFDKELCGPTNQLLFVPIELLIKYQQCEERENDLSQKVKRLASKYVEAKETISKSDRKRLLLWIDFFINPQALCSKANDSAQS